MRASQFINESPLKDLENRLPKIKSDQYDVDEKGKIYRNAKSASKQAHKARQELTASDQMFDDGLNIEDEAQKGADWMGERLQIENMPKIVISYDTEEAQEGHHTGRHEMGSDEIWVYGLPHICEPLAGLNVPESVRRKLVYTGYLEREAPETPGSLEALSLIDEPFILVTPGGGGDGDGRRAIL